MMETNKEKKMERLIEGEQQKKRDLDELQAENYVGVPSRLRLPGEGD
jgi:hypothetical protein